MKKIIVLLIIPVLLISCISSGEDITVHKDGSGQLVETFKIKKDFVGFLNLSDQPSDPNLIDMEALTQAAAALGEGVTLEKVVPMGADSPYAGYKAFYTFTDISKVRANASPATSPAAESGENGNRIHFAFTPGKTTLLTIFMPKEKKKKTEESDTAKPAADSVDSEDPKMKEQLKQIYKDMHYWITVTVEGQIQDTNARHSKDSTITLLDMSFEKIVNNDELFTKVTADNAGDMKDFMKELAAAGVLIEDQNKIDVTFK